MTDERLEQIRERAEAQPLIVFDSMNVEERERVRAAFSDRWTLIHEVERLRAVEFAHRFADSPQAQAAIEREHDRFMAEYAAMREVVQAVAAAVPESAVAREWSETPGWLNAPIDVVWVTKARKLLAESDEHTS